MRDALDGDGEEGNKGLVYADEHYDASKGYAFMSYAVWFVRMSILQALAAVQSGCPILETFTPRKRNREIRD